MKLNVTETEPDSCNLQGPRIQESGTRLCVKYPRSFLLNEEGKTKRCKKLRHNMYDRGGGGERERHRDKLFFAFLSTERKIKRAFPFLPSV
jgi:hypothetical protein